MEGYLVLLGLLVFSVIIATVVAFLFCDKKGGHDSWF